MRRLARNQCQYSTNLSTRFLTVKKLLSSKLVSGILLGLYSFMKEVLWVSLDYLFENGDKQTCQRYQDACSTEPQSGTVADITVLGFNLVGGYYQDIVLLHLVIG